MGLGNVISRHLKEQERSVAWLAKKTGISASTLRSMIAHNSNSADMCNLWEISAHLGVKPQVLILESVIDKKKER